MAIGPRPATGAPTDAVDCELVGQDGNAFSIVGRLDKALRRAGASAEYREAVRKDMQSGDYDHLLSVAIAEIDAAYDASGPEDEDEDAAGESTFDFIMRLPGSPGNR